MLKDLINKFSAEEMCEYCTISDDCNHNSVSPCPSNGEPIYASCTDNEVFANDFFDIDLYLGKNLDGLSLCLLCKNKKSCEDTLSRAKDTDKVKLPCSDGTLSSDWFEDKVFKALIYQMENLQHSFTIEIKNKEVSENE